MIKKIFNRIKSISTLKFYYQRSIKNYRKREEISDKIAKKIGKSNFKGVSIIKNNDITNELSTKGFINFGNILSENEINILKEKLNKFNCFDPFRPNLGSFSIKNIPPEVHVANYKRSDLAKVPEIIKIANDPKILNLVQDFLGATPTISNINCWWSTSSNNSAEQAQFFHRDVDDYRFCKVFVYLTGVNIENGPHVFVENSISSNSLTNIRRYQDFEIEDEFGKESIKYFTAPKGSMFLVNTYGFHKGLLPNKGNRLLLQIQYSLNPIGIEKYEPVQTNNHNFNKYVNRLILK